MNRRSRSDRDISSLFIAIAILLFGCLFLILIITISERIAFFKLSGRATLVAVATVLGETRTALASTEPASTPVSTSTFTRPPSTLTPTKSLSPPTRIKPTVTPSSTRTPTQTSPLTPEPTFTPSSTPVLTSTLTPEPTFTPSSTPILTFTSEPTFTPSSTSVLTSIPIFEPAFTPTSTLILTPTSLLATVDVEILNFRAGPGTDYEKIGQFEMGTELEILVRNEEGDWFLVRTEEGREGWVAAAYVRTSADLDSIPVAAETPSLPVLTPSESPSPSPTEASTEAEFGPLAPPLR